MTPTEIAAHDRLQALQDRLKHELGSESRGIKDLASVSLSKELLSDIALCIASSDHLAILQGLYVLQGVMVPKRFIDLPKDFSSFLVQRIEELLDHPIGPVVFTAMGWYAQYHSLYPGYRQRMLKLLASADLGRREAALRYFDTYSEPREIEPLLRFEKDDYASETRMMGDYIYVLRDQALAFIEKQLGTQFPKIRLSEPHQGATVTWNDWRPFLQWWNSRRKPA